MFLHYILRATPVAVLIVSVAMAQPIVDTDIAKNSADQTVPRMQYKSTFSDYVPYSEQKLESWRQANDTVGEIGGWRTYSKEARQPDPPAVQPPLNDASLVHADTKEVK